MFTAPSSDKISLFNFNEAISQSGTNYLDHSKMLLLDWSTPARKQFEMYPRSGDPAVYMAVWKELRRPK